MKEYLRQYEGQPLLKIVQETLQMHPGSTVKSDQESYVNVICSIFKQLRKDGQWGIHAGHLVPAHEYAYIAEYRMQHKLTNEENYWFDYFRNCLFQDKMPPFQPEIHR